MIEYVIVRAANTRRAIGVIDNFTSIIWESVYFGVGTFEIYAPMTKQNLYSLLIGNYVTRNNRPRDVGIIENVNTEYDNNGALMIIASGRFAKSILDRRLIYKDFQFPYTDLYRLTPVVFTGKCEVACRNAVDFNIINPTDRNRKIDFIKLGQLKNLPGYITNADGSSQTTYGNLLEITDGFLKDCNYSAYMSLDENGNLLYNVYEGVDRSATIRFSQELDNLIKSNYNRNEQGYKNFCLIGGSGEGLTRLYSKYTPISNNAGINRREIFVDANDISREYTDDNNETHEYTAPVYASMLQTKGKTDLKNHAFIETYNGEIDITANNYVLGVDYNVGDIVYLQDNVLNYNQQQRIYKATEVQDENGYNITISFDSNNN